MKKKIYLVGGFIRDKLLNNKNIEKDWIIQNINFFKLLNKNFNLVGKNFPVFLNKKTTEEYALTRKERKIKKGHKGFKCYFSKKINFKTDITRRDLSINSLILNNKGKIIDIYNLKITFKNKLLKNISLGFQDDPLRIFRIARFYTKYYKNGFIINATTYFLIKNIIKKKEIFFLSNTRITNELKNSLIYTTIYIYIYLIYKLKILKNIIKDLNIIIKKSNTYKYNIYLNIWLQMCNNIISIKKTSNNILLTITLLLYYLKNNKLYKKIYNLKNCLNLKSFYNYYKNTLLIPEKIKIYIKILIIFNLLYQNINKNKKILKNILNKINIKKNKIIKINALYLIDDIKKYNTHINYFYIKYLILDILDNINKKNIFNNK